MSLTLVALYLCAYVLMCAYVLTFPRAACDKIVVGLYGSIYPAPDNVI